VAILKKIAFVLFLFLISISVASAKTIHISANSFTDIQKLIQKSPDPKHTLLVVDDDDTLTMMPCKSDGNCQYLGGPAWFAWQSGLAPNDSNRIWKTFPQLLKISNFLFAISKMPLDDTAIPAAFAEAANRGVRLVVETARSSENSNATERQFTEDRIFSLIKRDALKTSNGNIGFAGVYLPSNSDASPARMVSYINGIFYVAGQNKGVMLQGLLKKTKQEKNISEIIFVDDTPQNVTDVANAYKNNRDITAICVNYTKLDAHKNAFISGPNALKLQSEANMQWYKIRDNLKEQLLSFML